MGSFLQPTLDQETKKGIIAGGFWNKWMAILTLALFVIGVISLWLGFKERTPDKRMELIRSCITEVNQQFDGLRLGLTREIEAGGFTDNPKFLADIINSDAKEHQKRISNCF